MPVVVDLAATLRAKFGVKRRKMKILGVCNPEVANCALDVNADVSLLLPCNVVLSETDAGTRIAAVNPRQLLDDASLLALAQEAAARLTAAPSAVPTH